MHMEYVDPFLHFLEKSVDLLPVFNFYFLNNNPTPQKNYYNLLVLLSHNYLIKIDTEQLHLSIFISVCNEILSILLTYRYFLLKNNSLIFSTLMWPDPIF